MEQHQDCAQYQMQRVRANALTAHDTSASRATALFLTQLLVQAGNLVHRFQYAFAAGGDIGGKAYFAVIADGTALQGLIEEKPLLLRQRDFFLDGQGVFRRSRQFRHRRQEFIARLGQIDQGIR